MAHWMGSPAMSDRPDEFAWISSLTPLTRGDSRALGLGDDAAILPSRPGYDLVISKDAMTEGVHFLRGEYPGRIAQRLLRTSLSDLAAKGATPFGYFLMTAWPDACDVDYRHAFAQGLAADGAAFDVSLLGGDTIAIKGPLTLSATVLGWVPQGRAVLRSGAQLGDRLVVCGTIGDGLLGLRAARGELADLDGNLAKRYRLPVPLLTLAEPLLAYAHACADVSDGLLADAGHVARASGLRTELALDRLPMSSEAETWLSLQDDAAVAVQSLAAGGDDYALVCAVAPSNVVAFVRDVDALGVRGTDVGQFVAGEGVGAQFHDRLVTVSNLGWQH